MLARGTLVYPWLSFCLFVHYEFLFFILVQRCVCLLRCKRFPTLTAQLLFFSLLPSASFLWDDYTVEVRINDYLDIVCPHYTRGKIPSQEAERYVLYMVELEDYEACKPQSFDQLRWECSRPFAPHAPEKFSEKFQRYTPFTLGKEFRQGESYYYICKYLHLYL